METWIQIEDFPEYAISQEGRVKRLVNSYCNQSKAGKILRPFTTAGYPAVTLLHNRAGKNVYIHRLVAKHFIPNPDNKPEVNHIDGIKKHGYVKNLEWVTVGENRRHAFAIGIQKIPPRTLTRRKISGILKMKNFGLPQWKIAKKFGVSQQSVSRVFAKKAWVNQ